jgi:hypothetical protein
MQIKLVVQSIHPVLHNTLPDAALATEQSVIIATFICTALNNST